LPQVNFKKSIIQKGLLNVISNTGLMGRWQSVNSSPQVILDVAHNKEGLKMIMEQLNLMKYGRLYLVMGFVKGRNVAELLSLFPNDTYYYLSSPNIDRALKIIELKKQLKDSSLNIIYTESILKAYENALLSAKPQDLILVLGSTFTVSEVLKQLKN
jgi:dihydrofolate synthase/folylpolyglutamate synthase